MAHDNKTEQPTEQRRKKARERGQVARSRDLSGAFATLACVVVLSWGATRWAARWLAFSSSVLNYSATHDLARPSPLLIWTASEVLYSTAIPITTAWMLAIVVSLAQGGFVFAPAALAPKLERLSPGSKLSQLFSVQALASLLKASVPAAIITYLIVSVCQREWSTLLNASTLGFRVYVAFLVAIAFEIAWKSSLAMLIWSVADYLLVRQKFESDLKMSREEVREEMKQSEGNPQVKGRIRRLQRQARRSRMMKDVAKATVVIVNPTHFAVAIEYRPDMAAPVVVAKGRNRIAEQIKEIARWNDVPITENPPLAQALYRTVKLGQQIPSKLYTAVAEILAFVFRMQSRAAAQKGRRNERT